MKPRAGLSCYSYEMGKQRVLFVCVGNSCRSQMAEGFARTYGSDVMVAASAGLYPAPSVARLTREVMAAKNIDLNQHFPKSLSEVDFPSYDVVVNLSGYMLPIDTPARVLHWEVDDPIGENKQVYERIAGQVEMLVMQLVLELRKQAAGPTSRSTPKSV